MAASFKLFRYSGFLLLLLFGLLGNMSELDAQEEEDEASAFEWGISAGAYFASGETGDLYSGRDPDHGIERVFAIERNYRRIREELNSDFEMGEYPENMSYQPAFAVGLNAGWRFREDQALEAEFLFSRLILSDRFTIFLTDPSVPSDERIVTQGIEGAERRFLLTLDYRLDLGEGPILPYMRIGPALGWVEAESNHIEVEGERYPILPSDHPIYGNPSEQQGMILGADGELGLRVETESAWDISLGAMLYYSHVDMGSEASFAFQQGILLRAMR